MMTCPACGGSVHVGTGLVFELEPRHKARLDWIFFCARCPLVSEIDHDTGELIDLGAVTLAELSAGLASPIVTALDPTSALCGRRDS